jgi:hypothetical protein
MPNWHKSGSAAQRRARCFVETSEGRTPPIAGSRAGHSRVGVLRWSWWEAGVANDYFLVHASRPVSEALIRPAGRLAPTRGSCRGGVGAA